MARDTGFPGSDAQFDFSRARRKGAVAELARRLRRQPGDVNVILPFDEVVEALGRKRERSLGLQVIDLDSIVGSVDRGRDFDRDFRPTSSRVRGRWERIAAAARRGESLPPIRVYRIGEVHFVEDGHHRVSVARALGGDTIDAYVTEIVTEVGAGREITLHDLPVKSHERLFFERVPLEDAARKRIELRHEWHYAALAEGVEAWGFRFVQGTGEPLSRQELAQYWFKDEYEPVVEGLRGCGLIGGDTETEAYIRVATMRYMLLRTHDWDAGVLDELRRLS